MDEGSPENVLELAAACVRYVASATGVHPDFSAETLPLVDHYLASAREQVAGRPELTPLIAQAAGAYFGEVVCRTFDCFWRAPSANLHDHSVCGRRAFFWINPYGAGYDALLGSTDHGGPRSRVWVAPEDRQVVEARLAALPEVDEQDFHTLTTHIEALDVIVAGVKSQLSARGLDGDEFDPEDYEAELRPLGAY
jgi:hypothetical protein